MRSVSIHRQLGERAAAGTGDLPSQQLDDAVVHSVVVRFHDSVSVPVTEPKQSGLLDGGSQQLIEFRIGCWQCGSPTNQCAPQVFLLAIGQARMRRTDVRPMFNRRAISALGTPARCSFRISATCSPAVIGRPNR